MQTLRDKTTVLVVDDSPDSLGMINQALDKSGIAVLIALNGQQALSVLQQITPDVILMDAVMPQMDGFECAQEVRKKLPLVPIIFMTGLSEVEHVVKAFEAGGNDYIVKPIHPEELLVRIRQHTNSAHMLIEAQKALDTMHQHVFSIDSNGHVLWATPEAQILLGEYQKCSHENNALDKKLKSWLQIGQQGHDLALPLEEVDTVLTVSFFKTSEEGEYLLKIHAPNSKVDPKVLEQRLSVTSREAEVLLWLAHGKTNREIAEILEMSPRTVNKHLEQMYPKIGTDNRTAAASVAIQTILGGRIGSPVN